MNIPGKMKAAVLFGRGDLRVIEKDIPAPTVGECLIKVHACAICGSDPNIIKNGHPGQPLYGEFTPGHEFSGEVVDVGPGCSQYSIGDRVAVEPHKGCGVCINCLRGKYTTCINYGNHEAGHRHYGFTTNGGYAEYAVCSEKCLHQIPDNIVYSDATLLTTAGTALYGIQNAGWVIPGETVLVSGPGPIGLMATQLVKACGAGRVIVTGTREERLNVAKELGADNVINIRSSDLKESIEKITNGAGVDLAVETSGTAAAARDVIDAVNKNGRVIFEGIYKERAAIDVNKIVQANLGVYGCKAEGERVIDRVIPLMEKGAVTAKGIITHYFSLEQINDALDLYISRRDGAIKVVIQP